jgi:two-component system OmpR family response regulator
MRVLVVEDEPKLGALLQNGLRAKGHPADLAREGEHALALARARPYDAIVLDVMLPDRDGFEVCTGLRGSEVWAPVIMLTARDSVVDRIRGLDAGADDYLVKPFSFAELLARLRALARRQTVPRPAVLEVEDLRLDPASQRVWRGEHEIELSPTELRLLEALMRRPGMVLSRGQLIEHAWDDACGPRSNVVDVHVAHLREKIDRRFGCTSLQTVRGLGYRLARESGG